MADAQKKADSMRKKTQDFHRLFTAGDSESVIQGMQVYRYMFHVFLALYDFF
jgi:hypothetical protein